MGCKAGQSFVAWACCFASLGLDASPVSCVCWPPPSLLTASECWEGCWKLGLPEEPLVGTRRPGCLFLARLKDGLGELRAGSV